MRIHLFVVTLCALAVVVAFVLEGLGFALIVALGLGIVLAIGFPLLVILSEGDDRRIMRRRP
jgi:Flp pilus assembly protein TadB